LSLSCPYKGRKTRDEKKVLQRESVINTEDTLSGSGKTSEFGNGIHNSIDGWVLKGSLQNFHTTKGPRPPRIMSVKQKGGLSAKRKRKKHP